MQFLSTWRVAVKAIKLAACKMLHNKTTITHNSINSSCINSPVLVRMLAWILPILVVCVVCFCFFQFGSGSFHFETEKGVVPPPPLTWRGKSLQSFVQEVVEEGGWAPFMPNITILIALMLFLVWRGGGRQGEERERETDPEKAQSALHSDVFNHCFFLEAKCDLYFSSAHTWPTAFLLKPN